MLFRALIFCLSLSSASLGFAYPNFIGKGYHNCLTCHYNPFGNGPLNDYGRGVAASAIGGRLFINDSITDEKLSDHSGFLFNKAKKDSMFKPAFDYRGMTLRRNLETDEPQEAWINMQMDANLTVEFGENKKFLATYTYSIVPSNSLPAGKAEYGVVAGEDLVFSREHYLGYKISPNLGVYLGKMDKVFGIRVPDHTAYSRLLSGNGQYGSSHGVVVHYGKEKFDLGGQVFIGDLQKDKEYQSTGIASKFEYSVTDKVRMGLSFLNEAFEESTNTAYSFLTKMGVGKGSSLMFEMGRVSTTPETGDPVTQQYIFLQNHFYIFRGFYFLTTYEQRIPDTTGTTENHRFSPGFQYFPFQRLEFRGDLTNSKEYSTGSAAKDTWEFLGQVHLWF